MKKTFMIGMSLIMLLICVACNKKEISGKTSDKVDKVVSTIAKTGEQIPLDSSDEAKSDVEVDNPIKVIFDDTELEPCTSDDFEAESFAFEYESKSGIEDKSGDYKYIVKEDGTAEIKDYIKSYRPMTKKVTIPSTIDGYNVTSIGNSAFAFVKADTVIIPEGIKKIGRNAFYHSDTLQYVTLPESLEEICDEAFDGCKFIREITIPDNVRIVGNNPFFDCERLRIINVTPENDCFATIDGVLFGKADKSLICYPAGLQVEKYVVPNGIKKIEKYAFYRCNYLKNVELPNSVTEIESYAFSKCDNLEKLFIPEGVEHIGEGAFWYCISLKDIQLPASLTIIENKILEGTAISDIIIHDSVTHVGKAAFGHTNLKSVAVPASVKKIDNNPFEYCSNLERINVEEQNSEYFAVDGVLFNKRKRLLVAYPASRKGDFYSVPEGTFGLGISAFSGANNLTGVFLPESVEEIGSEAFAECTLLENITLPKKIKVVRHSTFLKCSKFTEIAIPEGITEIGENAFLGCSNLVSIHLPDSIKKIGIGAFKSCKRLVDISIPASVSEMGSDIFYNCNKDLAVVVQHDSYAAKYCMDEGINYIYPDANDWLNQ